MAKSFHALIDKAGKLHTVELADQLTSKDSMARVFARGAATGAGETLAAWVEDEVRRGRGQNYGEILLALATLQINVFASIVQEVGREDSGQFFADFYKERIDKTFVATFQAIADAKKQLARQGSSQVPA